MLLYTTEAFNVSIVAIYTMCNIVIYTTLCNIVIYDLHYTLPVMMSQRVSFTNEDIITEYSVKIFGRFVIVTEFMLRSI